MRVFRRFWADEAGFIVSAELVLVATMLVIGMIVGLTSLRNQVVQELTDLGAALGMISQGYEYTGTSKADDTTTFAVTDGSGWDDLIDECQNISGGGDAGSDVSGGEPGEISVRLPLPVLRNSVYGENVSP
jgi:Flp pilus assembly pilin Flp